MDLGRPGVNPNSATSCLCGFYLTDISWTPVMWQSLCQGTGIEMWVRRSCLHQAHSAVREMGMWNGGISERMFRPPNGEGQRMKQSVVLEERNGECQQRLHEGKNAPVELEGKFSKQINSWALGTFQGQMWPSGSRSGMPLKGLSGRGACMCVCMHVCVEWLYCILKTCWSQYGGQTEGLEGGSRETDEETTATVQARAGQVWTVEEAMRLKRREQTGERFKRDKWQEVPAACGHEKEVHSKSCC